MRFSTRIFLIILFLAPALSAQYFPIEYADQVDSLPIINDYVPDSNFTFMSYALPNNPNCQLVHDNHLYLGSGAVLQIYELGEDGLPTLTGQVSTHGLIRDIEHDGEYVYLANDYRGLTIYEGDDFENPAEVSHLQTEFNTDRLLVWGDSLFYNSHYKFGLVDVADRSNPFLIREFHEDSVIIATENYYDLYRYQDYLVIPVVRFHHIYRRYIGIFELSDTLENPVIVDSIDVSYGVGCRGFSLYDNRIYIYKQDALEIYEIEDSGHPVYRSSVNIDEGRILGRHSGFCESSVNGSRIGFLGIFDLYPGDDSSFATIHAYSLDDLSNPVFIDSTESNNSVSYDGLTQNGNYTYGLGDPQFYVEGQIPGLFVYQWFDSFESELIGHYRQYSFCTSVEARGDVCYAGTVEEGMILLDITDKTSPQIIGEMNAIPSPVQMEIIGDRLYVLSATRFITFDITDPSSPVELNRFGFQYGSYAVNFDIHDDILYICYFMGIPNGFGGLLIADISDLDDVEILYDVYNLVTGPQPMVLDYPIIYMLSAGGGNWQIRIYDVTDPSNPQHLTDLDEIIYNPLTAAVWGDYLYSCGALFEVYDVSRPQFPVLESQGAGDEFDIYAQDGYLFITHKSHGIFVWDLESSPIERQDIGFYLCSVRGNISIDLPYVYIPGKEYGLVTLRFDAPTGIDDEAIPIPEATEVLTAYPNPFNSTVSFQVQANGKSDGSLQVYNIAGRLVCDIYVPENDFGYVSVQWDGKNNQGDNVSSGIYFARYGSNDKSESVKIVLLK
ncbi:MAG: T9SS type A sorting domain-containing protein [candidate division Zixibacteria bacterium]|nr:T9SS type A sorting domain-containing protein [candidate division Zixibacteria bacterium]